MSDEKQRELQDLFDELQPCIGTEEKLRWFGYSGPSRDGSEQVLELHVYSDPGIDGYRVELEGVRSMLDHKQAFMEFDCTDENSRGNPEIWLEGRRDGRGVLIYFHTLVPDEHDRFMPFEYSGPLEH